MVGGGEEGVMKWSDQNWAANERYLFRELLQWGQTAHLRCVVYAGVILSPPGSHLAYYLIVY